MTTGPMTTEPMIRAASLRGFAELVSEQGGDPAALLRRFGIPDDALLADDRLISITAHDLILDAAARDLACPDLGLRLAVAQDLTILGPLALAIESAGSVAEALDCAARFMDVHSPALRIGVEPDPAGRRNVVAFAYRKDLRESPYSPQAIELGLGLFHRTAVRLLGDGLPLYSVRIPHQPLSPVSRYTEFFDVPDVRFGAPFACLIAERSVLDERLGGANAQICALAQDYLAQHFPDPRTMTAVRVRTALTAILGIRTPSMADVARLLALHPRTLQRRLSAEGTSFAVVLDEVRRDTSYRYIVTTNMRFSQVASLVGFNEQSTLSHAVRRWFGVDPRGLRAGAGDPGP